jgi:hypothetical protein
VLKKQLFPLEYPGWNILAGIILWRREFLGLRRLLRSGSWLLLYGRRKTGKSFMTRLLAEWSIYSIVARDGTIVFEERGSEPRLMSIEEAIRAIAGHLRRGDVAVIDEFQRLPESVWEMLASMHPNGQLILVASSLGVVERVFSRHSPLLGLAAPWRIDLLRLSDVVVSLLPRLSAREAVLWALLLREPWLTSMPGVLGGAPWDWITSNARLLYSVASGLVGEVFTEEERKLTRLYDAVLRLLGDGVWDSKLLAALLYQRGLIESPSPSTVTGVLDKLASMGLVAKTRLWMTRGKRIYYRHSSPLLAIVYGLAERHAVDEYPVPPSTMRDTVLALYARELQFSLAEMLAEHHDGVPAYTILPRGEGDVDIVVLDKRAKYAIAAYEVKMGTCSRSDLIAAYEKARKISAAIAGAICFSGADAAPPPGLRILEPEDVAEVAKQVARRASKKAAQ